MVFMRTRPINHGESTPGNKMENSSVYLSTVLCVFSVSAGELYIVIARSCSCYYSTTVYNWGERSEAPLFWVVRNRKPWYVETGWYGRRNRMVRPSKPDGTAVETGWYDRTSGRGLPLARDRSAAEPPAPRFTAILADTAELSHCQERPGLVNLPIGLQGQHC